MRWSVVVVAKGMWSFTKEFLDSFISTTGDGPSVELIYVDNGTPVYEDSWRQFSEWDGLHLFAVNKMLKFREGVNLSRAWNEAVGVATGERVLVCNNDLCFLKPGWLDLIDIALEDKTNGVVGMTGMSWRNIPFIQGSLFAFRRELFEEIGQFDERFEFTCEDVDFCKKAQDEGHKIHMIQPALLGEYIFHHEGATRNYYKEDTIDYQRRAHRSRLEFCYKWLYPAIEIHD